MPNNIDNSVSKDELENFIKRIENLEEEKTNINNDIKEVYSELKGRGFDTKIIKKIVVLRKKDPEKRQEEQTVLELYMEALGMRA